MDASNVVSLACIVGLLVVLGGGVLVMLYGVRGVGTMLRGWVDRK